MAKGYHQPTAKNPFAGGRLPIWPCEMTGKGNIVTINIPRVIKVPVFEFAKLYAQYIAGNITKKEVIEKTFQD